ncbi:MAG: hypothetical protein JW932_04790, partial [Deltaproteobacteria bacterium]|nr:hypothetical protein [Deltaproteobacteria bacterium]
GTGVTTFYEFVKGDHLQSRNQKLGWSFRDLIAESIGPRQIFQKSKMILKTYLHGQVLGFIFDHCFCLDTKSSLPYIRIILALGSSQRQWRSSDSGSNRIEI